jgi:hypothetical protein
MGFGGPVWHASVSPLFSRVSMIEGALFEIADLELRGVGDVKLGGWHEVGDKAVHLRRRLTDKEMQYAGIDTVVDVRGTDEMRTRIRRMRPFLPPQLANLPDEAYP